VKTQLLMPNAAVALAELILLAALAWLLIRIAGSVLRVVGDMFTSRDGRCLMPEEQRELLSDQVARVIKFVAGLGAFGVVAYNGWLTAAGYNAADLVTAQVIDNRAVTLRSVGIGAGQILAILVLLKLLSWLGARARVWIVEQLKAARVVRVADERIDMLGYHFAHLVSAALWLAGGLLIAGALNLPDTAVYWISFVLSLIVVWALVRLISDSLDAAVDAIHESLPTPERDADEGRTQRRVQRIVGSVKTALRWAVYVGAGAYVLRSAPLGSDAYELSNSIVKAAAVIVGAQLALALGMAVIARLAAGGDDSAVARQRRDTMIPLVNSILRYVIYFVAAVMALQMLGVDVTAILAGAGIAGLAIGFGAQSLVQDVISGFFILFEGEYMVGDFVELAGVAGTVEAITLRATSIRQPDGSLAIVPNGQVQQVINYSKRFVRAVVDVGVSYEGDLDHALAVLERVARDAREDLHDITGPPNVRVTGFNTSDIGLRLTVPVRPGRHREVAFELRRRVKLTFDAEGVEIPFSRHVIIFQSADGTPLQELPVRLVNDRRA